MVGIRKKQTKRREEKKGEMEDADENRWTPSVVCGASEGLCELEQRGRDGRRQTAGGGAEG